MAPLIISIWSFALLLFCFSCFQLGNGLNLQSKYPTSSSADAKLYIVYMRRTAGVGAEPENHTANYLHILEKTLGSTERARNSLIYSYKHAINGFSALLSQHHVKTLAAMEGVVQIVPSEKIEPDTTNSWNFLGLSLQESINIGQQNSIIIGVIDSGINPELPSFDDGTLGPVPGRWKGACNGGSGFPSARCNRKLIGVRYYVDGYRAAYGRDPVESINALDRTSAHGTHVASTAAGQAVNVQSSLVSGVARGGNPLARLAVYKVFWDGRNGTDADILQAMEDAIADGVDIINLSLGSPVLRPLYSWAVSTASFSAMRRNILTVHSAGNTGPAYSSITATIPWTITVAATTTNREIISPIQLRGLDSALPGFSFLGADMPLSWYDLVSGESVKAVSASADDASHCRQSSIDPTQVVGKIVFCKQALNDRNSVTVKRNYLSGIRAAGMIIEDDASLSTFTTIPSNIPYPIVSSIVGSAIFDYIQSSASPMARILQSRVYFNWRGAPTIAGFSCRGPNNLTRNMLKPDIAAPGVGILAGDGRQAITYGFQSGTSMAAPHVSSVASLLRAYHGFDAPWSEAALKSALMTTASVVNDRGQAITIDAATRVANPFDYGSGLMQPLRAMNQPGPGLIYDANVNDYVLILCGLGYDETLITNVFLNPSERANCNGFRDPAIISQRVNLPSIAIAVLRGTTTITRTLTNVATQSSTYSFSLDAPPGVIVSVSPSTLQFSPTIRTISYSLILRVDGSSPLPATTARFGSITWSDALGHRVRSPIVVHSAYATVMSDMEVM